MKSKQLEEMEYSKKTLCAFFAARPTSIMIRVSSGGGSARPSKQ
jgi:hypothetical protein